MKFKQAWYFISHLGVDDKTDDELKRGIVLSNQLAVIFIIAIVMSFGYLLAINNLSQIITATLLFFVFSMVLALNGFELTKVSRLLISILPNIVLFIPIFLFSEMPPVSFFYIAYSILAFSLISVLVFNNRKEKLSLYISLLTGFIALLFYDRALTLFSGPSQLTSFFEQNHFVLKAPLIQLWFVIVLALLFLKWTNQRFEGRLNNSLTELHNRNKAYEDQLEKLSHFNEELLYQQEQIMDQRNFIEQKNKELKKYQDELLDYVYQLSESKDFIAQKEAENKSLLDALRKNFIMIEFDIAGVVQWVTPRTLAKLGLSENQIVGKLGLNFIQKIDDTKNVQKAYDRIWKKILSGESASTDLDLKIANKTIHISSTFAPIFDENRRILKIFAIAEDISDVIYQKRHIAEINAMLLKQQKEIRDQNEELQQQKEEIGAMNETLEERVKERTSVLAQKNRQLAEYAFINAHMLRAPVSSILGLMNLLEYEKLNSQEKEIYNYLIRTVKQLDNIVFKINNAIQQNKEFDREFLKE